TLSQLQITTLIPYTTLFRTKLPPTIGYKQILEQLCINYVTKYEKIIKDLLRRKFLVPYQGDEEDPAHPAIYPTGVKQKKLSILQDRKSTRLNSSHDQISYAV